MNRSKDLDTIAPDDDVVFPSTEKIEDDLLVKETTPKIEINTDITEKGFPKEIHDILGHTKYPFSSFLIHPKTLKFTEQEAHEVIYLAVRPHWVTNISWVLVASAMFLAPLFFGYFSFLNTFPIQYGFAIILFWYLITFTYAFEKFLAWYFDFFLVTNERIVDIDFNNLLNKHFAEADIDVIQDVSFSVRGILGTFFNFGTVLIQTASDKNQIFFKNVPNPEKIMKLLKELRDLDGSKGEKL